MSKTIFFVCDHLHGGGAERINLELADEFIKNGYSVTMLLLDGEEIGMKLPYGINIINLDIAFKNSVFRSINNKISIDKRSFILSLEKKLNPTLVILSYTFGFLLADCFKTPNKWLWIHSEIACFDVSKRAEQKNYIFYLNEYRRVYLERKGFKKIFDNRNIIAVNNNLVDFYKKYSNPNRVEFIPNGISEARFLKIGHKNKEYDAIYVGRLSEEKQIDIAINAFLDSSLTGFMAIVGDGPLKNRLIQLVISRKAENRVLFLGWKKNPEIYIKKSRMLLLTSKTEGFGLVVAESIILGVPVVAFNSSSGVEYQLSSGQLHRGLVELNNYDALLNAINNVFTDPYEITQEDKDRLLIKNCFNKFREITGLI